MFSTFQSLPRPCCLYKPRGTICRWSLCKAIAQKTSCSPRPLPIQFFKSVFIYGKYTVLKLISKQKKRKNKLSSEWLQTSPDTFFFSLMDAHPLSQAPLLFSGRHRNGPQLQFSNSIKDFSATSWMQDISQLSLAPYFLSEKKKCSCALKNILGLSLAPGYFLLPALQSERKYPRMNEVITSINYDSW